MGDQAPPNFNPSVSLLSGGESVTITPIQGGGGLDDVSMLSGGEGAVIQPVKGGALINRIRKLSIFPPKPVDDDDTDGYVDE